MTMRNDFFPSGFVAVTPGTGQLDLVGFVVGVAGTVIVTDSHGVSTTITAAAGIPIHGKIQQITGGTATGIVGFVP